MLRKWVVEITTDVLSDRYVVVSEDSYDAKIKALEMFYDNYNTPAHLWNIEKCYEDVASR